MARMQAKGSRILLGVVLFASLVMGGATVRGLMNDAILQIALVFAATYTITRLWSRPASSAGLVLFAAVLCGGLAQIIPLPATLFSGLRPEIFLLHVNDHSEKSFSTLSVASSRTISSVLAALCYIYYFIALTKLPEQDILALIPFYIAGLSINLGILILDYSGATIYNIAGVLGYEPGSSLFANDNHLSTLLCASMPLVFYMSFFRGRKYTSVVTIVIILISLLAIGSRAGMLTGLAVLVLSLIQFSWRTRFGRIVVLLILSLAAIYSYSTFVKIGGEDVEATLTRAEFGLTTFRGIGENWRLGTGYGSFDLVYPHYEKLDDVYSVYVNHAHNDFLEIALEGGLVGILTVGLYLAVALARLTAIGGGPLLRLSFLSLCVVLLHSAVDYPLRTTAIATAFAFFNALFFLKNDPLAPVQPIGNADGQEGA